jgi:hypothetical protein
MQLKNLTRPVACACVALAAHAALARSGNTNVTRSCVAAKQLGVDVISFRALPERQAPQEVAHGQHEGDA